MQPTEDVRQPHTLNMCPLVKRAPDRREIRYA